MVESENQKKYDKIMGAEDPKDPNSSPQNKNRIFEITKSKFFLIQIEESISVIMEFVGVCSRKRAIYELTSGYMYNLLT